MVSRNREELKRKLFYMCMTGKTECVREVLNELDAENMNILLEKDYIMATLLASPIELAARNGHIEVVELLLRVTRDEDAVGALAQALKMGHPDIVHLLIFNRDVDTHMPQSELETYLEFAVSMIKIKYKTSEYENIIDLLLNYSYFHSADIKQIVISGETRILANATECPYRDEKSYYCSHHLMDDYCFCSRDSTFPIDCPLEDYLNVLHRTKLNLKSGHRKILNIADEI